MSEVNISSINNQNSKGFSTDITNQVQVNLKNYLNKISPEISPIASEIMGQGILAEKKIQNKKKKESSNVSQMIREISESNAFDTLVGENSKIPVTMKDYDLIKRTLPQVHKIIHDLRTSILNPEVLSSDNFLIELPPQPSEALKAAVEKLKSVEGYDINTKIDNIVEDHLIISRSYYTVTPYNALPRMLASIHGNVNSSYTLNEAAIADFDMAEQTLLETFNPEQDSFVNGSLESLERSLDILVEASTKTFDCKPEEDMSTLMESAGIGFMDLEKLDKDTKVRFRADSSYDNEVRKIKKEFGEEYNNIMESFGQIELVQGLVDIYRDDLLSEAAGKSDFISNASMSRMIKAASIQGNSKSLQSGPSMGAEERKKIDKLSLKGCFVEKYDPSRIVPLIAKSGRKLGYFYTRPDLATKPGGELSAVDAGLFSSLNSKLVNKLNNAGNIPQVMSMEIAKKLLTTMDSKFLANNIANMDEIYEFIQEFIMVQNRTKKKIHFIHPDDMIEFSRPDGSIMKNCIVIARLAILLMVSNIMAKVTTGYDKELYFFDMGVSTDVASGVEDSINALLDSRITMDAISSLEHVFGVASSSAPVFIPRSTGGERMIDPEIISGQDIDMDEDFIRFLINSMLLSFGVEPSAIDYTSEVEYARTLSMVDVRIAKNALKEQKLINPGINKLVTKILTYEMGEDETGEVLSVEAKLQPPKIIILEMMDEIFGTVTDFSEKLGEILIEPDTDETVEDKIKRYFNKHMLMKYIPNMGMDEYEEIIDTIKDFVRKERADDKIANKKEDGDYEEGQDNPY